jgi:hypothetical protein
MRIRHRGGERQKELGTEEARDRREKDTEEARDTREQGTQEARDRREEARDRREQAVKGSKGWKTLAVNDGR